jgi:hypothetical protein
MATTALRPSASPRKRPQRGIRRWVRQAARPARFVALAALALGLAFILLPGKSRASGFVLNGVALAFAVAAFGIDWMWARGQKPGA